MPDDQKTLTERQQLFCHAYVYDTDGNGTRAAWRAGYCGADPSQPFPQEKYDALASQASRLLAWYPHVENHIAEMRSARGRYRPRVQALSRRAVARVRHPDA